jgi:RNA polymerase sigma-70 factor (ECF subfamily)
MSQPDAGADVVLSIASAAPSRGSELEHEVVAWFDQLRDRLARYVIGFGLPVADAEEVIQETFLSLFEHLRKGRPKDNLRGWLFRVAHNLALKRRYDGRRTASLSEHAIEDVSIDPSPNPEEQSVAQQSRRRVHAVVQALPERDRRCLDLRAEGLSYREIAEVLDMSLGGVSVSLARSLARIARATDR